MSKSSTGWILESRTSGTKSTIHQRDVDERACKRHYYSSCNLVQNWKYQGSYLWKKSVWHPWWIDHDIVLIQSAFYAPGACQCGCTFQEPFLLLLKNRSCQYTYQKVALVALVCVSHRKDSPFENVLCMKYFQRSLLPLIPPYLLVRLLLA